MTAGPTVVADSKACRSEPEEAVDRSRSRRGTPPPSSLNASATGRANQRRDTGPELRVRSALHSRGLRFRVDLPIRVDGRLVRPDVVFTRYRVAVFIDGCFWHGCAQHSVSPKANAEFWAAKIAGNKSRDTQQTHALETFGWSVLRYWEHMSTDDIVDDVAELLRTRAAHPAGGAS
jgi:DNA mismatch endonuclease (patch repair protein)